MAGESLGSLLGPEEVPEYYTDSVRIAVNLYSFVLELGVQGIPDTQMSEKPLAKRLARVRMSPQHALVLSKLLQKHLRDYQANIGPIPIPDSIYRDLNIPKEDR